MLLFSAVFSHCIKIRLHAFFFSDIHPYGYIRGYCLFLCDSVKFSICKYLYLQITLLFACTPYFSDMALPIKRIFSHVMTLDIVPSIISFSNSNLHMFLSVLLAIYYAKLCVSCLLKDSLIILKRFFFFVLLQEWALPNIYSLFFFTNRCISDIIRLGFLSGMQI